MTKLEYLTCLDDCYFDTNYYPTTATSVYFKYSFLSSDTGGAYGGIVANNGGDANGVQSYIHNNAIEFGFCGSQTIIGGLDLTDVVECEFDRDSLTFNGTSYSITSGSNLTNNPFYINCLLSGNWSLGGNYYRVKFYEGNTLAMDLVPCIDNNNTVCFYDEVGQSYIYPSGSGTPTAGPVVTNNVKYVDYIEINNPNRLNQGFQFTNTASTDCIVEFENATFNNYGVGSDWESFFRMCDSERGRIYCSWGSDVIFDGHTNKETLNIAELNDSTVVLTKTGVEVDGTFYDAPIIEREITNYNNIAIFNFGSTHSYGNQIHYGKIGTIRIYSSGNTLMYEWKPCIDNNNDLCFYETVNGTYYYPTNQSALDVLIAGPLSSTIIVSADKTRVPASGGTINVTVNSFYDWTASSTGNWYTMSSTSGTSADTAITITVPSTTSVTQVEDTILFTNATGDTDSLTIKQSKYNSGGTNNFFIGTENVEGMMIGGQSVEAIYLGTEVVYSPGPFVGLKVRPSEISFAKESGLTSSLEIKQGNTVVFDGKAAVDNGQGIVGLYDTVSGDWFYNTGLSMTYGE